MTNLRPVSSTQCSQDKLNGIVQAIICYLVWGSMPLYWKLISSVPALEVLSWRMVFSGIFLIVLCVWGRRVHFLHYFKERRACISFLASGLIVTINWGVYVWATNAHYILEASLGYYLCPLSTVLLGQIFFKESITKAQVLSLVLAAIGTAYFIAHEGASIWISLVLALSFSCYGAVKKKAGYEALSGMAFESLITGLIGAVLMMLALPFPGIWNLTPTTPAASAVFNPYLQVILLMGAGVLTAIPMLLFSSAANKVPLTILGFIQYLGPSIALVIGAVVFGEEFSNAHGLMVLLVWTGVLIAALEPAFKRVQGRIRRGNTR